MVAAINGRSGRASVRDTPCRKPHQQGGIMADREQAVLMKEIQVRLDRKIKENEIEFLEYWKEQVDQVAALKPEGVAALQMRVRRISEMMANRIRTLKREP
jgi:hypothetical protein